HVQGHQVVAALQHHDVRVLPGGLHILLMHGLHSGEILGDHGLERPAPLLHIPQGPAEDPLVRVRLHKDLDVEHIPQSGVLEDQNALHNDDLGGLDLHGLVGAVVLHKGVDGALDGASGLQLLQVADQQVRVKGVGVVIVHLGPLLIGPAHLALVIAVMADDGHVFAEVFLQMP
ncbi:putative protein conserved in bacteria, partial [Dysosmobacter welbionis]